jgi:hypothetical protein
LLSSYYRDIHLFRYNDQEGYVYIIAGAELEIIIDLLGIRGLNETRFLADVAQGLESLRPIPPR